MSQSNMNGIAQILKGKKAVYRQERSNSRSLVPPTWPGIRLPANHLIPDFQFVEDDGWVMPASVPYYTSSITQSAHDDATLAAIEMAQANAVAKKQAEEARKRQPWR